MGKFYDKDGSPLELLEWAKKFEDKAYCRVALDILPDGTRISTVWLGLNHNFGEGPPLIFETMVFDIPVNYALREREQERYSTLEEAQAGHAAILAKNRCLEGMPDVS
jgi:hypothetical protein